MQVARMRNQQSDEGGKKNQISSQPVLFRLLTFVRAGYRKTLFYKAHASAFKRIGQRTTSYHQIILPKLPLRYSQGVVSGYERSIASSWA